MHRARAPRPTARLARSRLGHQGPMNASRSRALLTTFALATSALTMCGLAACGGDLAGLPDAGGGLADAGAPDADAGAHEDGGAPPSRPTQRAGRSSPAPIRAVLPGARVVLLGADLAVVDPEIFGRGEAPLELAGGLTVLDPATGAARLYTHADGWPEVAGLEEGHHAPAPIYDLAWLEEDTTFVAASWTHLVKASLQPNGGLAVEATRLRRPGAAEDAKVNSLALAGGELFVGTDQGFAAVAPATLTLLRWIDVTEGSRLDWTRATATARIGSETVVLGLAGPVDSPAASDALILRPGSATAERIDGPAGDFIPTAAGAAGEIALIAYREPDGRGALYTPLPRVGGGFEAAPRIGADQLARASSAPFVPARMAWDPAGQRLILGGSITFFGPQRTGGLAVIPAGASGELGESVEAFLDRRDPYTTLLPWQVHTLAVDRAGRAYVAGWNLCSEHRAGVSPLLRLEAHSDGLRLVRPVLSGVRVMTPGPEGALWLGLRDEHPGLRCDGLEVHQSVCRLRADGACEIWTPYINRGEDSFAAAPGATAITFGDPERRELALATSRDATFVRLGDETFGLATQLEPGLNLEMTAAAFSGPGDLWLGSSYRWDALPGFSEAERALINARGPQGLGFLPLGAREERLPMRRYVRQPSDQAVDREEIGGLPSSNVRAISPLAGTRRVLVGLARERLENVYDHLQGAVAPTLARGGMVIIEDRALRVVQTGAAAPADEVVAFARAGGALLALDAERGVFTVDEAAALAELSAPAAWSAPERALSLAANERGDLAVGTTTGLFLRAPGGALARVALEARTGYVWALRFEGDVLLAGTDEGLLRVGLGEGPSWPVLGPEAPLPREPWPLQDLGCHGEAGCFCYGPDHCAPGLDCLCQGPSDCRCDAPADPCARDPGGLGCSCSPEASGCGLDLECRCEGSACSCQLSSEACNSDCTCPTPSGCTGGLRCQGGVAGRSCI